MEPLMIKLKLLNSCSCHTLLTQGSPVQETSGNLSQLEQELQTVAQAEQVAKEAQVVVVSGWVVYQQGWYRVVAVEVKHGKVALQFLD